MRFFGASIFFISSVGLLGGCTKMSGTPNASSWFSSEKPAPQEFSEKKAFELLKQNRPQSAADEFANIGELLLHPYGVRYADKMFDQALSADPNHLKANLLSAFAKPMLLLEGIGPRIELLSRNKERRGSPGILVREKRVQEFLMVSSDKAPFRNYSELQTYLKNEVLPALKTSAERIDRVLKNGGDVPFLLDPATWGITDATSESGHNCYNSGNYENSYTSGNTRYREITHYWTCTVVYIEKIAPVLQVSADATDLKILRGAYLGLIDTVRLHTAYNIDDLHRLIDDVDRARRRLTQKGKTLSSKAIVEAIKRYPSLGTLHPDHEVAELQRSLPEVANHLLDLASLQHEMCTASGSADHPRKGRIFKYLCLNAPNTVENLRLSIDLLSGPRRVFLGWDENEFPVEVLVDVRSVLQNPPRDLKSQLPSEWDRNGKPVYADLTMGGLFPEGDLFEKIKKVRYSQNGMASKK